MICPLRWDKVIICTDADVDGFQIRTLVLAMFYRLTPTLIQEGKIYMPSPRFEISKRKGQEVGTHLHIRGGRVEFDPLGSDQMYRSAVKGWVRTNRK